MSMKKSAKSAMSAKSALRIGAVATGAALALGATGSAYAATPTASPTSTASTTGGGRAAAAQARLQAVQALANARLQGRLATLHALSVAVSDSKYLTSSEQSTLANQIASDISGLTALQTKAGSETTAAAVRTDETAMVDDYRVYMVMAPQVRLTEALSAESDAATTLQKAYVALSDLLAKQSGSGTAQQKSQLADLQTQITAAQAAIGNEISVELAVQPGPDASAIQSALAPVRSATKTAHGDLIQARNDAKALRNSLKA